MPAPSLAPPRRARRAILPRLKLSRARLIPPLKHPRPDWTCRTGPRTLTRPRLSPVPGRMPTRARPKRVLSSPTSSRAEVRGDGPDASKPAAQAHAGGSGRWFRPATADLTLAGAAGLAGAPEPPETPETAGQPGTPPVSRDTSAAPSATRAVAPDQPDDGAASPEGPPLSSGPTGAPPASRGNRRRTARGRRRPGVVSGACRRATQTTGARQARGQARAVRADHLGQVKRGHHHVRETRARLSQQARLARGRERGLPARRPRAPRRVHHHVRAPRARHPDAARRVRRHVRVLRARRTGRPTRAPHHLTEALRDRPAHSGRQSAAQPRSAGQPRAHDRPAHSGQLRARGQSTPTGRVSRALRRPGRARHRRTGLTGSRTPRRRAEHPRSPRPRPSAGFRGVPCCRRA